ncbi:MAG: transglycosylase SLT domain-containing protein [Methylobacteriaceae bacterium]|jgi:hypothetical protein|nr:transglycosylase SLT domain-containing protein [Methylobacteriaceae bacterium]
MNKTERDDRFSGFVRRFLPVLAAALLLAGCQTTGDPGRTGSLGRARNPQVAAMVDRLARKHNVPTHIAHGVVRTESNYRCNARNSRTGATGVMQVLPATARAEGVHGDLTRCEVGMEAGMRYLRKALERGGTGCEGVSLYERGIYAPLRCTGYGRKVISRSYPIQEG